MHGSFDKFGGDGSSGNEPTGSGGNDNNEKKHDLGFAGSMAKSFIHSPLSPLLFVACLLMGIMGLFLTPRQEDPQISVPMADVFLSYPGASAEQVASLAIDPLERMMSEIPGVEHVYSAAQRGQGMVTVQFKVGEETGASLVKLYDKLKSNADQMPPGVSQPLVKPKGADDVPVVTLTLWSNALDDTSLRQVALEMRQRLKEVPDTASSFIVGGRSQQMRIEISPERLQGFGIAVGEIARAVQGANVKKNIGSSEQGTSSFSVYSGSFLKNIGDLENLVVGIRKGTPVYMRDVATITAGPGEAGNVVQYYTGPAAKTAGLVETGGAPAVTIAIAKKSGSNGVTVAQAILDRVESLKGSIIPDNLNIAVTRNYGKTAGEKVNGLILKIFVATGAVVVLIFMALGFIWQPAMVVALVIPVVILITVFSAYIMGFTIDRVSLFALIFSIGILVDDAIVVVENIYRRWLIKGEADTQTTIDAVAEVGNPTILATFTVIAALLPMGFVSGMMGPYMGPIPALGSVAMLFSLIAAFMFTPWLVMRIKPSMEQLEVMEQREHKQTVWFGRIFGALLGPLLDSPRKAWTFRLVMWGAFFAACALFYTQHVTVKMLPLDNKPEFNVVVNMKDGTALPTTANAMANMTQKVLGVKEVTAVQTYTGTSSPFNFNGLVRHTYLRSKPWQGDIQIQLLDKHDRDRSSHQIAEDVRALLTPMADKLGASIQVVEMPPGPPVLQTMVAEIYGPDAATRRQVARDMTAIFKKSKSIVDVDNYLDEAYDSWTFEVDQRRARKVGITASEITEQLSMVMGGFKLGDVKIGHELEARYIVLQAPLSVRADMNRLLQLPIRARSGALIPLRALGSFKRQATDLTIYHKDLRPVEYVTGEVSGELAAPVYGILDVNKLLAEYKAPDGVALNGELWGSTPDGAESNFVWGGEWTVTFETFRDMGAAFMVAMVLIYMLVVWEFGSFRIPAIIMAPIPLTLIGIIPAHWMLGASFTATSMIGWIALAGIIVRNSILLVDFAQQSIREGMTQREAVLASVVARARPILITAFALVAGSSVIITDPIFNGMAISLMFGVLVATALTLFVIPMACMNVENLADLEDFEKEESETEETTDVDEEASQPVLRERGLLGAMSETVSGSLAPSLARTASESVLSICYLTITMGTDLKKNGLPSWSSRAAANSNASARFDEKQSTIVETTKDSINTGAFDDLTKIYGIGAMIEKMLNRHGFFTYGDVSGLTKADIAALEGEMSKKNKGAVGRIARDGWITEAASLQKEAAQAEKAKMPASKKVRKRRAKSSPQINRGENDNLRQIRGIGLVIEKILLEQGITRLEHVASMTARDIERIGAELDKKPRLSRTRIARDNWIEQAQELLESEKEAA